MNPTNLFSCFKCMCSIDIDQESITTGLSVNGIHHQSQIGDLTHFLENRDQLIFIHVARDLANVKLKQDMRVGGREGTNLVISTSAVGHKLWRAVILSLTNSNFHQVIGSVDDSFDVVDFGTRNQRH